MARLTANTSDFLVKIASLGSGDTLYLADGNYGSLSLFNRDFGAGVTIRGGSFSNVVLYQVKGLKLESTEVQFTPTLTSTNNSQAVRIFGSDNIVLSDVTIRGGLSINGVSRSATELDSSGNVIGLPVGKGINIDQSRNVVIEDSEVVRFHKGITFSNSSDVTIANNTIHDLRTTPISGSVEFGLRITGNHTYDSNPWNFGGGGDHGDRIHIWTKNTAITGLVITDNVLEQGRGAPMLGIYLDDNGLGLGFRNAVISGNRLTDGHASGVLLENVTGTVTNNTLTWSGYGTALNNAPRFVLDDNSHDLSFTSNGGNVVINAGVRNVRFNSQRGEFNQAADLNNADRASIVIDNQVITGFSSATLAAGKLDLTYSGTGNFTGRGNALANKIMGGAGDDVLIGNGGADRLVGKAGNDTYHIDNAAQTIVDTSGTDTVYASISYTLQAGLEHLTYTGRSNAVLSGNVAANTITGGNGNDRLIGNGGADSLRGGLGDDTYVIDNLGQSIVDTGGADTVIASLTYSLIEGIENLTLIGTAAQGVGNSVANVLRGNSGNNTLDGKQGADTMYGGGGNDIYVVDNIGDRVIEVELGIDLGGIDLVRASSANFILGAGVENLTYTGLGNFVGTGNGGENILTGGIGNDSLFGLGDDDQLFGGSGNDRIDGGAGRDRLTGGTGNDVFVLAKGQSSGDMIMDFRGLGAAAGDVIQLKGWGAGAVFQQTGASIRVVEGGYSETFSVVGAVHVTDIFFG